MYCGRREGGKTTAARNFCLEERKKDLEHYEIAYIRRYKNEMQKSKRDLFKTAFEFGFEFDKIETKGNITFLDGVPFCHYFNLSTDARVRGVDLPNLRFIIFDEFLLDNGNYHYLKNEVEQFLSLYETIARPLNPNRPRVPVLFIANSYTMVNPYFNYFKVRFRDHKYMDKTVYAEIGKVSGEEQKALYATEWGQILKNTTYGEHAIENKFYLDDEEFIQKDFEKGELFYIFRYGSEMFGAWLNYDNGALYISYKYDQTYPIKFSFTAKDLKPNELTQSTFKGTFQGRLTRKMYNSGAIYYESLKIKNMWYEIVRRCNI